MNYYPLFTQSLNSLDTADSTEGNFINFSTNRYLNTYIFKNLTSYDYSGIFGDLRLIQNYTGNAILSTQTTFRDDYNLLAQYGYRFSELLGSVARFNWLLSSDTRSIDLNKVEISKSLLGLKLHSENIFDFTILSGYESNRQLGFNSVGMAYAVEALLHKIDFEQYEVNASANGYLSNLTNDRTNSNLNIVLNLKNDYDENNRIALYVGYLNTQSANFIPIKNLDKIDYNIENRAKNHLIADLNLKFKIFQLDFDNILSISNRLEDKYYNQYFQNTAITGVNRQNHELILLINSNLSLQNEIMYQSIGLFLEHRDENFLLRNRFDIALDEELLLRDLENRKDNTLETRRLFYNGFVRLSRIDTIRTSTSVSIFRFDTPSEKNDDDYDKLMILGAVSYLRKFTNQLTGGLTLETQHIHLVNLKAKQSALNNWYRSLRLGTNFSYNDVSFSMNPRFDLIANYTIYDFEDILPNVNSISFRQIGIRDSIYMCLDKEYYLNLSYIMNYNERGILYWRNFAESPQRNNLEIFIKLLFFFELKDKFKVGLGGRYYNLSQKNLALITQGITFLNTFFGPEVYVDFRLISNSFIRFEGWGDFQPKKSMNNMRPNFYLTTFYKL